MKIKKPNEVELLKLGQMKPGAVIGTDGLYYMVVGRPTGIKGSLTRLANLESGDLRDMDYDEPVEYYPDADCCLGMPFAS